MTLGNMREQGVEHLISYKKSLDREPRLSLVRPDEGHGRTKCSGIDISAIAGADDADPRVDVGSSRHSFNNGA